MIKFGGLPMPGATVTAMQGDKKLVTISDQEGIYSFPDMAEGAWTIDVEMLCFQAVKQEITVGADAAIPDFDLKLQPLEEIRAQAGPEAPPIQLAVAPATAPAPEPVNDAKSAKKAKKGPPPAANTPGGFQKADVNAAKSDAATQSNAAAAQNASDTGQSDDLSKRAADGFLVNGTSNNGASSPFATNPAFGNNRIGIRSLYNGSFGFKLDNSALDARQFSITGQDQPKPSINNFTGMATFGGPIKIPHLITNGPFIFFGYQWTRNRTANTLDGLMPTQAQTTGNFSELATPVLDPLTKMMFPGNIIPLNRISPQATDLLSLYPAPMPNLTGKSFNYQLPLVTPTHQDNFQGNLNKSINRKNQLFGRWGYQDTRSDAPNLLGWLDATDQLGWTVSANWRHSFTNRFWTTLGYTFSRQSTTKISSFENKTNTSENFGIAGNDQDPKDWGPPNLSFASIYPLTDAAPSAIHNQTGAISDQNFWNHGRHNITFGGDFKRQASNINGQTNPRGTFVFTGASTGDDLAGFLLGIPDTSSLAYGNADKYLRDSVYDLYAQDDLRVMPSLTIKAGLRWDFWTPITELQNRLVNLDVAPDFSTYQPVLATNPIGALTGLHYPNSLIKPDPHGFEPNIGLSWRPLPASSMVVRAGYEMAYNTSVYQSIVTQMDQQAPLSTSFSAQNSATTPLTLANGFLSPSSKPTFGVDPNFRIGYVQTWTVSVQRDLPGALLMTAVYTGIKGTRGAQEFYPNTYPYGGVDPCPACLSGYTYVQSNGNSTREAGSLQLRRRLHNGITANLTYTYSKSIDDASMGGQGAPLFGAQNWLDLSAERGLSSFDQRHLLTVTGQYTSGMGMHGGTLLSGWRGALLKEWTILTNINVGTGLPLTPLYSAPVPPDGLGTIRADYTGAPVYEGQGLNPAAYTAPPAGQWGTAGRDSITGPFQFSLGASLQRTFRLNDKWSLDLRVDSTNTLNHVVYGTYGTTINSAQFGIPINPNQMRAMQTTVRVRF